MTNRHFRLGLRTKFIGAFLMVAFYSVLLSFYTHQAVSTIRESVNQTSNNTAVFEIERQAQRILQFARGLLQTSGAANAPQLLDEKSTLKELEEDLTRSADSAVEAEMRGAMAQTGATLASVDAAERLIIWLALTMIFFAIITGLLLAHYFSKPIIHLRKGARRIQSGDFSARVNVGTSDEVGELNEAFNQMAEALSQSTVSRSFLQDVIESMNESVIVVNSAFEIIFANQAFRKLSDNLMQPIEGQRIFALLESMINIEKVENLETLPKNLNGRLNTKSQGQIPVSFSLSVSRCGDSANHNIIIVIRDIRETEKIELELQRYRERISRSERLASLGTLGAIIAHKLNQPLTSIRLFLQQARKGLEGTNAPEIVRENITDCLSEIEQASKAVQEVLQDTKKPIEARRTEIVISEVAFRAARALYEKAREASLQIVIRDLSKLPPLVANQLEIEEIFYILLNNAIQAARPENENSIEITGNVEEGYLALHFRDTCGGIPAGYQDRLFDPFFSTKPPDQGSGLGLSILRQIATNYNGTLEYSSEDGKGSSFTVKLPLSHSFRSY